MHPAHVPLEPEPEPTEVRGARNARPRRRLLGGRDDPGLASVDHLVELLQERDRVEILAAAELVRHPLAFVARVVEVQHRRHRVHPDPVDVVLAQPEQRVRDQEVADLVASVVEHERAPVGVLAAARIGVLVQRGAVEPREPELVTREVRRDPVEDHPDVVLVQAVDELAEVVGRAVERRRGEVPGHLVAPRALERVRHHGQELDVGEAHVLDIRGQLVGELEVGQRPVAVERVQPPGAEVHLVDRDRALEWRSRLRALAQPLGVAPAPGVLGLEHDRCGLRWHLGLERVGVGLQQQLMVLGQDLVLVTRTGSDGGKEQLPDPGRSDRAHRVQAAVPRVEVADDADRARGRRPHRERGAGDRRFGWAASISRTCAPSFS